MFARRSILLTLAILCSGFAGLAEAGFPPKDFVQIEGSTSPNDRYALFVPTFDSVTDEMANKGIPNYLGDIKAHKSLGQLTAAGYAEHTNHQSLSAKWSEDSSWCVVRYDGRFGFDTITVVEIQEGKIHQIEIGSRVISLLKTDTARQKHERETYLDAFPYFRLGNDRKLRMRALSTTNPKELEDQKSYYSFFQGIFDLGDHRWTATDVRAVNHDEHDALDSAYLPQLENTTFPDDESEAKTYDEHLNDVYQALRVLLPPARFAEVKKDQVAWLKNQNEKAPARERTKAWKVRIKVLEKLLW